MGRAAELASVAEALTKVEAGQPWLVAIEGDPGVGKTARARRCRTEATGLRVLSARADQAETDLDFGIVDQLLRAAGGVFPTDLLTPISTQEDRRNAYVSCIRGQCRSRGLPLQESRTAATASISTSWSL